MSTDRHAYLRERVIAMNPGVPEDALQRMLLTAKGKPRKWSGGMVVPMEERLLRMSMPEPNSGCWLWMGAVKSNGYAGFWMLDANGQVRRTNAHRASYEFFVGPVPEGLVLDHKCRVRSCINPLHLEPVTYRENMLRSDSVSAQNSRKTHCKRGHPLSGDNLKITSQGRRQCVVCYRINCAITAARAKERSR